MDIGGTKTLFALYDERFRLLEHFKERTRPDHDAAGFRRMLDEGLERMRRKAGKRGRALAGVGVGCAGVVDRAAGVWREAPNIPFIRDYPLAARATKLVGAPCCVANDAQFGLYGEQQLGAARGRKHVLGLFFGTGIGGAAIVDGRLLSGARGAAGEVGHFLVSSIGALAGAERQGVLDDLASRVAMAGAAASIAAKQWAPALFRLVGGDVTRIRASTLAESIRRGDKKIEEMVRGRARTAGIVLADLVDFLNCEMVVLGGGLVEAMPRLFVREIGRGIAQHVVPELPRDVRVVAARLGGRAVAAGAAKMAWDLFASERSVSPGA